MTLKTKLSLSLAALLLAGSACMKKPELDNEDGPQSSAEDIASAVVNAWGDAQIHSISLNEFVQVNKEYIIGETAPQTVAADGKSVTKVVYSPDGKEKQYTVIQEYREFKENNQQSSTVTERTFATEAPQPQPGVLNAPEMLVAQRFSQMAAQNALDISFEYMIEAATMCRPSPQHGWNPTCHNLKTYDLVVDPPAAIRAQPDCGGLPNCKLLKRVVSFDLIVPFTDENGVADRQKLIYTIQIAPDAPFLSRVASYCYQGMASIKDDQGKTHKFPLTVCQNLANFDRGIAQP